MPVKKEPELDKNGQPTQPGPETKLQHTKLKISKDPLYDVDLIICPSITLGTPSSKISEILGRKSSVVPESVLLTYASFETDSGGYEDSSDKFEKFYKFHIITSIENNFPFEMANQPIFKRLSKEFTEIVFPPYATQISESLHTLHSA
jgi:hypothetical protein